MRAIITIALLFFTTFILGCGNGVRVTGKVMYEDDGSPLSTGVVVFENDETSYRAVVKPDGSFALGVTRDAQKIPAGNYKVWLADTMTFEGFPAKRYTLYTYTASEEYTSVSTTPLTAEVNSGSRFFELKVKKAEPAVVKVWENGKKEAVKGE
jgi:hypothetical protein